MFCDVQLGLGPLSILGENLLRGCCGQHNNLAGIPPGIKKAGFQMTQLYDVIWSQMSFSFLEAHTSNFNSRGEQRFSPPFASLCWTLFFGPPKIKTKLFMLKISHKQNKLILFLNVRFRLIKLKLSVRIWRKIKSYNVMSNHYDGSKWYEKQISMRKKYVVIWILYFFQNDNFSIKQQGQS